MATVPLDAREETLLLTLGEKAERNRATPDELLQLAALKTRKQEAAREAEEARQAAAVRRRQTEIRFSRLVGEALEQIDEDERAELVTYAAQEFLADRPARAASDGRLVVLGGWMKAAVLLLALLLIGMGTTIGLVAMRSLREQEVRARDRAQNVRLERELAAFRSRLEAFEQNGGVVCVGSAEAQPDGTTLRKGCHLVLATGK